MVITTNARQGGWYIVLLLTLVLACVPASAQTAIPAGSGSYASSLPATGAPGDDGGDGPTISDMLNYYQGGVSGYTSGSTTYHMWLSPSLYGSGKSVPTNQWWTYLMFGVGGGGGSWSQSTNNAALWVYPQVVAPTASGMWLYSPSAYENRAYGNPVAYMNAGPYLIVGGTAGGHTFNSVNPVVTNYGDWTLTYTQSDSTSSGVITSTVARGIPFTWCQYSNATPQITMNGTVDDINGNPINLTSGSFTATAFSMTSRGRTFGIFAPANTTFTVANNTITPQGNPAYMVYGLLPDPQHLSEFTSYAYALPTGSQMNYTYNQAAGTINTTWNLTTTALNGTDTQTLQGWLPHHYHNTTNNLTFKPYAFETPRGVLQFSTGTSWNISWKFRGIAPFLPEPNDGSTSPNPFNATEMDTDINQYESTGNHPVLVAETYDEGKELYTAASYLTMADQLGQSSTKSQILTNTEALLDNWYTYSGSGDNAYFGLLGNYGALIGIPAAYGSASLNDNHYHYGYFVDTSAIIGLYDPTWLQNYAPMIELIAKEYANWDRTDKTFPYLRVFDAWEGHSWASGYSFQSGQTQESYSESMDAWAGLFLLGNALLGTSVSSTTANNMIAAGAMGYTLESAAVNEYWQDTKHTNFPPGYNFNGVGTVWAGWIAYQQGFTADPAWNYAVSMLPEANWENYQTRDLAYEDSLLDTNIWTERADVALEGIAGFGLPDANNGFNVLTGYSEPGEPGDYFLGTQALSDPLTTVGEMDNYYAAGDAVATTTNLSAGDSCSPGITYYLAHASRSYGVQDYDYYTSIPSSAVYYNSTNGVRTAVIYNPQSTMQTATIYDNGTSVGSVAAPSHQLITYVVGGAAMVTVPAAPSNLTVTAGSGQIALSWSAVPGAASYDIYRQVSGGGYFFTNITGTSYTDTGLTALGQLYTYKVYAVDTEGMSAPSNSAAIRLYGSGVQQVTDWMYDLNGPSSKSVPGWYTNGGDLNDFGYDGLATRVDNDTEWLDYSFPNLTGFSATIWTLNYPIGSVQFFTSTNNGSTFTALPVTISAPTAPDSWSYYTVIPSGTMPSGVTDLKIQVASAGGTQNNWDPEIGPISFTYGGYSAPSVPTGLTATPGNATVGLTWTASGGATTYNLYRSTSSGGEGTTPFVSGLTGTTYTDNSVTNGVTYYYTVAAVNAQGTSAQSAEASATPQVSNTVTDPLNGFTIVYSKSSNWTIDSSNPTYFNGDTARATRTVDDSEYLVYKYTGITTFKATVYTLDGPISVATFYSSPDGVTYTQIPASTGSETATASGWGYYNIVPSGSIPSGTNYLKVQFTSGTGNAWDPQLGQISLTYGGSGSGPTVPSAPTGLTATAGNAQVALSWTASSGATSYNLYRATSSGGEGTMAYKTGLTSPSFTDAGLTNGVAYYYTVAAVNSAGTSAQSSEATATPTAGTGGPTVLTDPLNNWSLVSTKTANLGFDTTNSSYFNGDASRAIRTVNDPEDFTYALSNISAFSVVAWTDASTISQVNIWYSTNSGSTWAVAPYTVSARTVTSGGWGYSTITNASTMPAGTTNLEVQLLPGSSTAGDPEIGSVSITYSGSGSGGTVPSVPTGLTATAGNSQVALSWTASTGATSYNVYRSTSSGGEGTTAYASGITAASYTDAGVSNGTAYFYTVAAVNATGASAQSSQASATPAGAPAAPTGLTATAGNAQIALSWTASTGATSYNLYRSTTSGGEGTTAYATGITTASYTNTGLTNGTAYFYKVAAVNAAGTSAQSPEATGTPSSGSGGSTSGSASIDCGGSASSPFVADADFTGGSTGSTTSTILTPYVSSPVPSQAVLQSWRTGASFTYTLGGFTAGSGHTVILYMMEPTATAVGQRDFNVAVSGATVLSNFDIYAATGGQFKAIQENFNGTANSSGQIVISFTSGTAGAPIIEGITVN